ncbi:MAG: helix-turn-helix transcriptional regulator [Alphaproteobacteria bacterium]|nr:helix-turn-helix transcriptional regulator [Alphaproteobacteria bacterium]
MNDQRLSQNNLAKARAAEASGRPVSAYLTRYPAGTRIPPHHHRRAQFIHALNGAMRLKTAQGLFLVVTGQGIWIPAGVEHAIDIHDDLDWRTVLIAPPRADDGPDAPALLTLSPLVQALLEAMSKLPMEYDADGPDGRLAEVLVDRILALPRSDLALPMPDDVRARRLADGLIAQGRQDVDLAGLIRAAGLAPATATRLFRRECGLTPGQWLKRLLVLTAIERLTAGEAVTTVALDLGYESPSAFSAMFLKVAGRPPSAYRA